MAVPDSSRTRGKHIALGDVHYDIAVSQFADNYRAEWTCENCGESGAWAPISVTPVGAIELAEIAVDIHHTLVHGNRDRASRRRNPR